MSDDDREPHERALLPLSPASIAALDLRDKRSSVDIVALKRSDVLGGFTTTTCPQCGLNRAPEQPVLIEMEKRSVLGFALAGFSALFFWIWWRNADHDKAAWLPLCAECTAAHKRGSRIRKVALAFLALSPGVATALAPILVGNPPLSMLAMATVSVASIAATFAAYRGTRSDVIRWIPSHNEDVMLLGTSRTFIDVVGRENPDAFPIHLPPKNPR